MRLGPVLFYIHRGKGVPFRYRRKHREIRKSTMKDLDTMRADFEREEQNMLLLRYPYLTIEQERDYMKDLRPQINYIEKFKTLQREEFVKKVTFAERLVHLRTTEAWD